MSQRLLVLACSLLTVSPYALLLPLELGGHVPAHKQPFETYLVTRRHSLRSRFLHDVNLRRFFLFLSLFFLYSALTLGFSTKKTVATVASFVSREQIIGIYFQERVFHVSKSQGQQDVHLASLSTDNSRQIPQALTLFKLFRVLDPLGTPSGVKTKEDAAPKAVVRKIEGKKETLERHVPQMLLRGEQVAIIVKIN